MKQIFLEYEAKGFWQGRNLAPRRNPPLIIKPSRNATQLAIEKDCEPLADFDKTLEHEKCAR